MGEVTNGCTLDQVLQMIAQNAALSFVNSGQPVTLAQLMGSYPAGAAYNGLYANVSDLFHNGSPGVGGVREVVRCRQDVTNGSYAWTLQRDAYNTTSAQTSGTLSLTPLITPPTVRLTGTLLGNLSVTPLATNAYVGLRQRVIQNSTLGLFTTTITGLLGSNIALAGNAVQDLEFTTAGWAKAS